MGIRAKVAAIWATLFAVFVFPFAGKFFDLYAEQAGWYDDPEQKLNVVVQFLSDIAGHWWYQWATVFVVGFGAGLFGKAALRRFERGTSERHKAIAQKLNRTARTLGTIEENLGNVEDVTPTQLDRFIDEIRALETSLKKMGIVTPDISYEIDPIGFIERMRYYTSRVGTLIDDGHIGEAKKVGKRMSMEIRRETHGAALEVHPRPASRFADRP